MGEHRRKKISAIAEEIAKRMSDEGKLIEAGWVSLRMLAIPDDAPQVQVDEMRMAFMAGAQHLFHSIIGILDPGEEPTDRDLKRMELINAELMAFVDRELRPRFGDQLKPRHN
jgi:hypothetical protein